MCPNAFEVKHDKKPYWRYDGDSDNMEDLYKALLFTTSQVPPYINGLPTGTYVEWHPLEILASHTGYNKKRYSSSDINFSVQYNVPFLKGLSVKASYNKYLKNTFYKQFNLPYTLYVFEKTGEHNHIVTDKLESTKVRNDGEFLIERYEEDSRYQLNLSASYDQTFGKHEISGLLLYEQAETDWNYFVGQRNFFISPTIDQFFGGSNDPKNSTVDGSQSQSGRISYVGRVNYSYDQKYLFEIACRYDGSVRFATNKRWGFFPSASFGWRISEEDFFKDNVSFLDYLKLRVSSGLLGNDAVGGWQWMQRYAITNGADFGTITQGIQAGAIPNPNITWEKSFSNNIGIDSRFLNNHVSLSIDGFYKYTYDILGARTQSVPTTFGATLPSENYGEISTKGLEIELGYESDRDKRFSYYVNGNMGYAINKYKTLDEAANIRPYQSKIGKSTDAIWGYYANGILRTQADLDKLPEGYTIFGAKPELGMLNYRDIRGATSDEPDGKIDANDQGWIGKHSTAPISYGINLGGSFSNFNLDLYFQGFAGNDAVIDFRGTQARQVEKNFAFWNDHWTPDNPNAEFPRASNNQAGQVSTFWLRNASFLRLKNLTLSYSIPKQVYKRTGINNLRVYFTGTNLLLLQDNIKYRDPEAASLRSYPLMKNYSFGLTLDI